ncbi:hypothetical protein B0H10DRAFT_1279728 [Mycena sp. CBHHK59/15]|nr:hypothetical protein B0H10DRAFT_1279728 [Mycena sp. CBHHK59/15]
MASICQRCGTGIRKNYLFRCPPHMLPRLLGLFILHGDTLLTQETQNTWIFRLKGRNDKHALPRSAFATALDFAERKGLREFLGRLYYARVKVADVDRCGLARNSVSVPTEFPDAARLPPRHLQRVLLGAWSLASYWQRLITAVPTLFPTAPRSLSYHIAHCDPAWVRIWRNAGARGGPADVLEKLQEVQVHCSDRLKTSSTTVTCVANGNSIVHALITELQTTLADHLLGSSPSGTTVVVHSRVFLV